MNLGGGQPFVTVLFTVCVCVEGCYPVAGVGVWVGGCARVGGWVGVCFLLLTFSMLHYIVIPNALELNIHIMVTYTHIYHLCTISSMFY